VLSARVRHRDVELAGQRPVRHDEPGEPRAVLYGPRHRSERSAAGRLVAGADCLVCTGTESVIGAATDRVIGAATGRFVGAAATACATTASATAASATEARGAEGRRASPTSRSSATVA
jgi:hypothetical protein